MYYLIFATILFSLSFGLIKQQLALLPSDLVAVIRLGLAVIVFLPFARKHSRQIHFRALWIGAIEFGLMFVFYIRAFSYLQGSEVALLTTTTPLWVAILLTLTNRGGRYEYFLCALLSMSGSVVIVWNSAQVAESLLGVLFVQLANLCFAAGQVIWKRTMKGCGAGVMSSAYLGGALVALPFALCTVNLGSVSLTLAQWGALFYLGMIPTGVGFWLWNRGAQQVGATRLAVMNDLKIPVGVLLGLVVFGERLRGLNFAIGCGIILLAIYWGSQIDKKGKREEKDI